MSISYLSRNAIAATIFALVITHPCAGKADLVITFTENANGVTVSGSGNLETLDGLTFVTNTDLSASNQYVRSSITTQVRSVIDTIDIYDSTGFTSFSTLGVTRALSSDPGIELGMTSSSGRVLLPSGYTAGTQINFSVSNLGDTLSDFGLVGGDSWGGTWATGNATTTTESILFKAMTVPEPNSAILTMLACLTGVFPRRFRQRDCSA